MAETSRQDQFVALLEQHKKILFKVANSYCPDPADRPDLVQEIAGELWRSFDRFDPRYKFSTWTYRIALNVAISFYRSEARRGRHTVADEAAVLQFAAESPNPERDEDLRRLDAFIQRLAPLDRALVLLYLDGTSHADTAAILGISTSNVGTKIGRIKERLRRDFAGTDTEEH